MTKDIDDAQKRLQQTEGALTLKSSWSDSPLRRALHFRFKWRVDLFLPGVEQAELFLSSGFHLKDLEPPRVLGKLPDCKRLKRTAKESWGLRRGVGGGGKKMEFSPFFSKGIIKSIILTFIC